MARSLRLAGWSHAMLTAVLLASGSASAQIGGIGPSGSPLGMTSPLGIGTAAAVPRPGIPMVATELSTPGVSPMTSGTSPLGAAPGNITTCSSIGGSLPQVSSGMGGSMAGISSSSAMSATGTPARPPSSTAAARWETRQAPAWESPAVRPPGPHRRPRHRQEWGWGRRSAASAFRWARPSWEWEG